MRKQDLLKYLRREADKAEIQRINNWLEENIANQNYFNSLKEIWVLSTLPFERANENDYKEFEKKYNLTSKFNLKKAFSISGIAVAIAIVCFFIGNIINNSKEKDEYIPICNNSEQLLVEQLSDGTKIALSPMSEIQYSKDFGINNRNIKLKGNCYFDVTKNIILPFNINTSNNIKITVTGTKFIADTDPKNHHQFEIALQEGTVTVFLNEDKEKINLNKGEFLEINMNNSYQKSPINDNLEILNNFKNYFIFNNTPLNIVLDRLSKVLDVKFEIKNENISNYLFTADLNDNSIEDVLSIFNATMGIKSKIENNIIYLY